MNELIIGKTYSMTDYKDNKKFIFKILNKLIHFGKLYYIAQNSIGNAFMLDISLYREINEIKFTEPNQYENFENQSIEDKIKDLKKAIWYLGREIDNLEKEKNNG